MVRLIKKNQSDTRFKPKYQQQKDINTNTNKGTFLNNIIDTH